MRAGRMMASMMASMMVLGLPASWPVPARAEAPLARFAAADPAALAAVEQVRGPLLRRVRANGLPVEVAALRLDLDGDGEPEILARLSTPRGCAPLGRPDCPLVVLQRLPRGRHIEIGTFLADRVRLGGGSHQGWRDIETRLDNGPWRRAAWSGTLYRPMRR